MNKKEIEKWEEEFNDSFVFGNGELITNKPIISKKIKSFIRKLLSQAHKKWEKKLIKSIPKKLKIIEMSDEIIGDKGMLHKLANPITLVNQRIGYNQALDDIISLIKK
jgi:fumarate hydratase class II